MLTNQPLIPDVDEISNISLGEKFETIVNQMPKGNITLEEILKIFEEDGLLLLSIFLALIFLVPVSIPGVSTIFGTAILLIGAARFLNRHLWLPDRITRRTIAAEKLTAGLQKSLPWFRRLEKIARPHRLPWLTEHKIPGLVHKLAFLFASVLLMLPFGFVPFSNTFPALSLIFLSIGEIEKDGSSILLGHFFNLATVIYFGFLVAGGSLTLWEGWQLLPF